MKKDLPEHIVLDLPPGMRRASVVFDASDQQVKLADIELAPEPKHKWCLNPLLVFFVGGLVGIFVHAWVTGTLFA